jgi:hypothetical protein
MHEINNRTRFARMGILTLFASTRTEPSLLSGERLSSHQTSLGLCGKGLVLIAWSK